MAYRGFLGGGGGGGGVVTSIPQLRDISGGPLGIPYPGARSKGRFIDKGVFGRVYRVLFRGSRGLR